MKTRMHFPAVRERTGRARYSAPRRLPREGPGGKRVKLGTTTSQMTSGCTNDIRDDNQAARMTPSPDP